MRITPADVIAHSAFMEEAESRAYNFISEDLVRVEFDPEYQQVNIHTDDTRSGSHLRKDCVTVSYDQFFKPDELRDSKINKLLI